MPSGEKFEALLLMNDIATKLQRGFFLPKGAPDEAVADLRRGYQALANDPDFVADYANVPEAERLEQEYTKHHLAELIQTGGVAGGEVLPPATTSEISPT